MTTAATTRIAREGKYLTFELDREEYGIEILRVREITSAAGLQSVPEQPACAGGAITLRGRTVPVVSMRRRLGIGNAAGAETDPCVVVVDVHAPEGRLGVGLLVDRVTEVRSFAASHIDPPPGPGGGLEDGDWIAGIGRGDEGNVCLIDVDGLLTETERTALVRIHGSGTVG